MVEENQDPFSSLEPASDEVVSGQELPEELNRSLGGDPPAPVDPPAGGPNDFEASGSAAGVKPTSTGQPPRAGLFTRLGRIFQGGSRQASTPSAVPTPNPSVSIPGDDRAKNARTAGPATNPVPVKPEDEILSDRFEMMKSNEVVPFERPAAATSAMKDELAFQAAPENPVDAEDNPFTVFADGPAKIEESIGWEDSSVGLDEPIEGPGDGSTEAPAVSPDVFVGFDPFNDRFSDAVQPRPDDATGSEEDDLNQRLEPDQFYVPAPDIDWAARRHLTWEEMHGTDLTDAALGSESLFVEEPEGNHPLDAGFDPHGVSQDQNPLEDFLIQPEEATLPVDEPGAGVPDLGGSVFEAGIEEADLYEALFSTRDALSEEMPIDRPVGKADSAEATAQQEVERTPAFDIESRDPARTGETFIPDEDLEDAYIMDRLNQAVEPVETSKIVSDRQTFEPPIAESPFQDDEDGVSDLERLSGYSAVVPDQNPLEASIEEDSVVEDEEVDPWENRIATRIQSPWSMPTFTRESFNPADEPSEAETRPQPQARSATTYSPVRTVPPRPASSPVAPTGSRRPQPIAGETEIKPKPSLKPVIAEAEDLAKKIEWKKVLKIAGLVLLAILILIGMAVGAVWVIRRLPKPAQPAVVAPAVDPNLRTYPIGIRLTGGWVIYLQKGTLKDGKWDPQTNEWLEGTEVRRVIAIPSSKQTEAVIQTLAPGDPIDLFMSNNDLVTYKVESVSRVPRSQVDVLNSKEPSLAVILYQKDDSDRWVVICSPSTRR